MKRLALTAERQVSAFCYFFLDNSLRGGYFESSDETVTMLRWRYPMINAAIRFIGLRAF